MKKFSPSAFLHSRYPLAILSGLFLAASFPKIGIAGFAWIAPALILGTTLGKRGSETFRLGYVAGLAHYLASLYWLLNIPVTGFPILGWVALAAFLALFPATWVWLSAPSTLDPRLSPHPWLDALKDLYTRSWSQRMSWAMRTAALWVTLEIILTHIFNGFPWNLLGDSQYRILPLVQFASFTGIYGVSFLVVWTSMSLLCAVASILAKPSERSPWMAEIILPFTVIVVAFTYGFHQLSKPAPFNRELKVGLVQPSIPQTIIWNPTNDALRFQDLVKLSGQALTNRPDLLIWPEASLPGTPFDEHGDVGEPIAELARNHNAWLLIGADDVEVTPADTNYFNASFLINPDGKLANIYHKRGLVMFGEYVPLENWLPFIKWFTPITGGYTPGNHPVQFQFSVPGLNGTLDKFQTSVLICFEDIFPNLTRKSVEPDTDFLVNITNDGWFGQGAAQWQQAAAATFRTIENGVPLIRCANTGITCWIDPNGRWVDVFTDKTGSVYGPGFMISTIDLPAHHPRTFYNTYGDWFGWACVVLTIMSVVLNRNRFKKSPSTVGPRATP